ncbi:MAG TPA: NAD-dependent epimerase/dehydratase family protein [Candidatus Bathyarchaeia archaeon]|nr:NAD-dependent epimerase/dehydratase family protein [Candidatus Bathyarchaeia archaeon]
MRILITGARGFIGPHLASEFLKQGHTVFLLDKENMPRTSDGPGTSIDADIGSYAALERAFQSSKPDVVYHLAAVTGVTTPYEQEELCLRTNVLGTYNVVKAAVKSGSSRIIFASSREVYGETRGKSTREDAETRPNNFYGLTKLMGEEILRWHWKIGGCKYVIFRIANVYGPGGEKYGIHKLLNRIVAGEAVTVMGGKQLMNFIYISDLVNAFSNVLNNHRADNQVFNLAGPNTMTIEQAVAKICSITGKKVIVKRAPMRPTETLRFVPNITKAWRVLRWHPEINFYEGIQRILADSNL